MTPTRITSFADIESRCVRMPSGCLEWQRAKNQDGYGAARTPVVPGEQLAHRIALVLSGTAIPKGLRVLHSCDNRACCEPSHLFIGTQADNVADMIAKGRANKARGERNRSSVLTDTAVRHIREAGKEWGSRNELARQYGVHVSTINLVVRRERWTHVV